MTGPSPGPWHWDRSWETKPVLRTDDDHVVLGSAGWHPTIHDARLIAAAPELLEMALAVASGYVDDVDEQAARALIARIMDNG